MKELHQANEHAKYCGKAVLAQPTPDDDDDTQVYKKPWVGLTDEDIMSCSDSQRAAVMYFAAMLKKKNA
jgi:hypothetical protein